MHGLVESVNSLFVILDCCYKGFAKNNKCPGLRELAIIKVPTLLVYFPSFKVAALAT